MENLNVSEKKIPYKTKIKLRFVFILTVVAIYISAIAYTKMQTKLYRTENELNFKWNNEFYSNIFKSNKKSIISLQNIIEKSVKSDQVILNTLKDLKLIKDNENPEKDVDNIKNRLQIYNDYDDILLFRISLVSAEPAKQTKIINKIVEISLPAIENEIQNYIKKYKENMDMLYPKAEKVLNKNDYQTIIKEIDSEYTFLNLLFVVEKPKIDVKYSDIPRRPFYPNERQSAIAGLILGLIIAFIIWLTLTFKVFFKTNGLTLFESKKEYIERIKMTQSGHLS